MRIRQAMAAACVLAAVVAAARGLGQEPAASHPTAPPATRPVARPAARPEVWMCPPPRDGGRCLRELFEHPDQWQETRRRVDVIGYADLALNKQFTDEQLGRWLPQLGRWGIRLGIETGAIKPWGQTAEKAFAVDRPIWNRVRRLGGDVATVAMDEPLCCCRKEIHEGDDYAVRETANFIALVRQHFPDARIGDIEPYPFVPLEDQTRWIDALQGRLAEMHVRGLDFYRLDVNWAEFTVFDRGNWQEVRKLERFCRQRHLPFSLIYWASGQPGLQKKGLADDSTWYVSVMQQGYDYALVDGRPDQYVVQSWIDAPEASLPETGEFTFTRSVRDFVRKFVDGPAEKGKEPSGPPK